MYLRGFLYGLYFLFQGQVFSQNLRNRLDLASSEAGPDSEDNSYLGYSLALGDFTGNGGGSDLAVGMPRAANLTGKVNKLEEFQSDVMSRISK